MRAFLFAVQHTGDIKLTHSTIRPFMPPIRKIFSRRWVWFALFLAIALLGANFLLVSKIKTGLRAIASNNTGQSHSESAEFVYIGPATAEVVRKITSKPYSIRVLPFDWLGEGLAVTHTAIMESAAGKIGVRLRFDPFLGKFHIVGFYSIH
jgi:hypothetical protein